MVAFWFCVLYDATKRLHMTFTDIGKIEKRILLRSSRNRVWRALTDLSEFCSWFGVEAAGAFAPGARIRMTCTMEDCKGLMFDVIVEEMEPERRFSWRWHPGSEQPAPDSREPMTLVVFELEETDGGTLLTVVETGFDRLSAERRTKAYRENEGGWEYQMGALDRYVRQME